MKTILLQFTWYWEWGLGYCVVFFLQQISYNSSDKTICRLTPSGFLLGCVAAVTTIRLKYCQRTGPAIQESRTLLQLLLPFEPVGTWLDGPWCQRHLYSCSHEYGKCPSSFCVFTKGLWDSDVLL